MRAITNWLDRFCYKHPRFGIPNLMKYIVFGNILVYLIDMVSSGAFSYLLSLIPAQVFHGEIWRLVTFIFIPVSGSNIFWTAISLYFYYSIGTAMEREWGTTKFNVFYLCGVILTVITGLLIGLLIPAFSHFSLVNMYYVNMSLFFALASLYPDLQFLLFFIIPVKAKWLAWADIALFAVSMLRSIIGGVWPLALLPAIAFINYLLFFGDSISAMFGRTAGRVRHQANPRTISFKKAQKAAQANKGYLHKCAVCGKTDTDYPDLEFRYCSKCNGYYCYCADHIHNHVHIE